MRLLIFLVLSQWNNFPNIIIKFDAELHFLTPGVTVAN